jgi:glycosyltransferase involved in cell wall biosynthesis/tetratricopeptide (TPR) repeat protein
MADNKYLGLNIIVGPNEADELERCLKSCQGDLLDEVVITTTSKDIKVQEIAEKYADITPYFEWVHDFAKARNYSFSHSTTKFILWLDADDVIKPGEYRKLLELKNSGKLDELDIALMDYVYFHDQEDKPVVVLPRERIVRNVDDIKWHDPIHEYMDMGGKRIGRFPIKIDHYRVKPYDPNRNLSLLEQEYKRDTCSERIKFYYGKELADNGDFDKAVPVLEKYVDNGKDFFDNLTVACIRLSRYYYHIKRDFDTAKLYASKGVGFNNMYAENFVMIGDVYYEKNDIESSIKYYKEALTKELSGGMSQVVDYYGYIPALKLATIYSNNRDYEEAKKYVDIAISCKKEDSVIELKKMIDREIEKIQRGAVLTEERKEGLLRILEKEGYGVEFEKNNYEYAQIKLTRENPINVAWLVPAEGQFDPALRIRRLNVSQKLSDQGCSSKVIKRYNEKNKHEVRNDIGDANIVVFTQFSKYDLELMSLLKESGKKIVFDICEALFGFPFQAECFDEADLITCCSTKLEQMANDNGFNKTFVIKDAIEERYPKIPVSYTHKDRPKAVFMGGGGNSFLATEVFKPALDKAGYDLVLITEWDNADIKWDINTWPDDFCGCDVAICPQRVELQPAKSNVKITTAMGLGMPVIASPLQAYKEIINSDQNGYICETLEEWENALVALRDPDKRKKIGEAGKSSVEGYSLDNIAKQWSNMFKKLLRGQITFQRSFKKPASDTQPTLLDAVDIIIPNYKNLEYLKMCVTSILLNTLHPFNIIISDAGSGEEVWGYLRSLKGIKVLGSPEKRLTFSEACNAGIIESRSKFFVILNSDTILSKGWLKNLVEHMNKVPRLAACNGLSNCDRGWRFNDSRDPNTLKFNMRLDKSGIELVPGMKLDTIKPNLEELYQFMSKSNEAHKDVYKDIDWVASYGTIFARSAVEEVGLYDTLYKNGCEDWDLCHRLHKSGFRMGHAMGSFIFHFGGVSRGAYQDEGREEYDREDKENHHKMKVKWSKPKIGIWTGPAWEPWDKATVDAGMAGSETWASYLAEEFVRKGFEVRLYNDLKTDDKSKAIYQEVDGSGECVKYVDHTKMLSDMEYDHLDYFISSRSVLPFNYRLHAGKRFVMVHDIWLSHDPSYDIKSWMVSGYAYLSDWHKEFLKRHHKIPEDKLFLTANGACENNYKDVDSYTKKNQAVYSSSPDRGLYQLLKMVPEIRKEVPDFTLKVAYGFYNWEQAAKSRNDTASLALIDKIKELINQPGVEYLGRVSKVELAEHQKESKVWLFPTNFTETFCIGSLENGISKNALITTDLAGLSSTVGSAGVLYSPEGLSRDNDYPPEFCDKFIKTSIRMLKDEEYRKKWADKAYSKMSGQYSWSKIADDWIKRFEA